MSQTGVYYDDEHGRVEVTLDDAAAVKWKRTFFRATMDYGYDAEDRLVGVRIWDDHGKKLVGLVR